MKQIKQKIEEMGSLYQPHMSFFDDATCACSIVTSGLGPKGLEAIKTTRHHDGEIISYSHKFASKGDAELWRSINP